MLRFWARPRRERGATAILVAGLAMVLIGAGALAVDMGQVYAKRASLQSNVDMAALAAAAELDNPNFCNPEVVAKAVEFLTKATNETPDQLPVNLGGSSGDSDGFIRCDNWHVYLWAPRSDVDWGLAQAVTDDDGVEVPAYAHVQIKSPAATRSLPMYAVSGCDYGTQQISDPPPGPPPANSPPVMSPTGTAQVRNLTVDPPEAPADSVEPFPVAVSGQHRVTTPATGQVVFVNPNDGTTVEAGSPVALPTGGGWVNFTINVPTVPQSVLDTEGIWWVRIKVVSGATTDYSPYGDSEPFTVGDLLFCNGVVSGNFGTLKIARTDSVPDRWTEMNIATGIEPTMTIYPAPGATSCSPADSEFVPTDGTDCVSTDPGFPNEAATEGFVTGVDGNPGRLDEDTTPNCDRNGGSSRTITSPGPQGRPLNDDLLTCFILGGHSVGDLVNGVPKILSADILQSPRFFQIPILPVEAANGTSTNYPIIDYRTGFVTDQGLTATRNAPGSVSDWNGLYFQAGMVERLEVVLFDDASLPETAPPVGGETDYLGHGIKVLVLVE